MDEDGQLGRLLTGCVFAFMILLSFFAGIGFLWLVFLGFIFVFIFFRLSQIVHWVMSFIFSPLFSLSTGPISSKPTGDNPFYQAGMDEAKRLVREEKWNEAISTYREILREVPKAIEPRFHLAQIYEKVGYSGLAQTEYQRIKDLTAKAGSNDGLIMESERAIERLKKSLSDKAPNETING